MTETITEHPLPDGSQAILTRETTNLTGDRIRAAGFIFEVTDYVSAEESEDGKPFYWGDGAGGYGNVCVPADAVALNMTAEQMRARKIPDVEEIASAVQSALCGLDEDRFETDETEDLGNGVVMVAGETREGLRFAAYVKVVGVERADF